jgi:hypothetical protein
VSQDLPPFRAEMSSLSNKLRVGLLACGFRVVLSPVAVLPFPGIVCPVASENDLPLTVARPHRFLTGFPVMPTRAPEAPTIWNYSAPPDLSSQSPESGHYGAIPLSIQSLFRLTRSA